MNGGVTASITAISMSTLAKREKKKKGGTFTHRKSAKTKLMKRKQPDEANGLSSKTVDILKDESQELHQQQEVESEKECAFCKKRGEHKLVDIRENVEMRKRLANLLRHPLKKDEPALANICVQCVVKINMSTEINYKLENSIRNGVNGQASKTTTKTTQNSNDISSKKQNKACLPKTSVQKNSIISSPTKSCSQSAKQQSPTPTTPKNAPPDLTIPQASRPSTPKPTATSTPASALAPILVITNTTSSSSLKTTSVKTKSCDVSPSPAYSPVIPRRSNESNTKSNTLADLRNKSSPSEVVVRLKREKNLQHQTVPIDLSKRNSSISDHKPKLHAPSPVPLFLEATKDISLADSDAGQNHSMLEVHYERSESALITESGGKINKYATERLPPRQLICPKCRTTYWRKFHFARHVRRCRAHPTADDASPPSRAATKKRLFYCNECPVSLDSMKKLRDHKHIHLQRFYCETCGKESLARQDHEFHTVQCLAKQLVLNTSVIEKTTTKDPGKRMTRSMSRAASRVRNSRLSDENSSEVTENEESEEEDDRFDAVSVADTMYTNKMRFTGHWLEEHSNSASNFSICDDTTFDFDDDLLSDKEFDHYLLDKLKMQMHLHSISCFVSDCDFHADNLVSLIVHEYIDHKMRLWFHCKKCRCGFTSKVHLDYHLACQNGGRFICYKCGDIFEFQHLLDRHLIRHTKCINHRCNYCNFEFLTENELLQHCDIEQHDANGSRKLISIDPTMTIVNPVAREQPNEIARSYHVRALEMKLPKMPTKRPRPGLSGHLPYRLRVGEVLFENQKNPNCWGWK